LEVCKHAQIVVGHCRWATHGSPSDNRNNHPHVAGRGLIVHNGVITNYLDLIRRFDLQPKTECDSEVIGLLMARLPGRLRKRAELTACEIEGRMTVLGLWTNPGRLLVCRYDNPLAFGETDDGIYFASLPDALPGRPVWVQNNYSGVLSLEGTDRPEKKKTQKYLDGIYASV
jgi:glucosamine 6-phosphate synthetase-like amidotransferase/phosphosugar isomerase protein